MKRRSSTEPRINQDLCMALWTIRFSWFPLFAVIYDCASALFVCGVYLIFICSASLLFCDASGRLCFVTVAFPGYLHSYF